MTEFLLSYGLSGLLTSGALASIAYCVHRSGKAPALVHMLWVVVLLQLLTPPLFTASLIDLASPSVTTDQLIAQLRSAEIGIQSSATAHSIVDNAELAGMDTIAAASSTLSGISIPVALIVLWSIGSFMVLARSTHRVRQFNALLARSSTPASGEIRELASQIASRLRLRSTPDVCTTPAHMSPMVWWLGGRIRIVLPETLLSGIDRRQLYWVLAHELAHVRRRDHVVRWIEWLACVLFWWNPVTWWARRNLRINEEVCCDAMVLRTFGPPPRAYADALMSVVEYLSTPVLRPPAMASEVNSGGFLEKRFSMIIASKPTRPSARWLRLGVTALALALLPVGVSIAEARPAANPMVEALRQVADSGALSDDQLRDLYSTLVFEGSEHDQKMKEGMDQVQRQMEAALDAGKLTREEAREKLRQMHAEIERAREVSFLVDVKGMAQEDAYLSVVREDLDDSVWEGDLTRKEANEKLAEIERHMVFKREFHERIDAAQAKIDTAVEAGSITEAEGRERLAHHKKALGAYLRLRAAEEHLKGKVESGDITQVEAERKIAALRERLEHAQREIVWEVARKKIEAAVKSGDMTREEADEAYHRLEKQHAAHSAYEVWSQVKERLSEAGVAEDELGDVVGAMKRIMHSMREEAGAAELDPRIEAHLVRMGLTDEQIQLVIQLSRRVSANHYEERAASERQPNGSAYGR